MIARRSRFRSPRPRILGRLRAVIARVPRGRVITYGQVAEAAGIPRGARLTVWALHRSEGLPWHRVVAAGGRIALAGIEGREQRLRLELEGVGFRGERVRIEEFGWAPRPRREPARRRRRSGRNSRVRSAQPGTDCLSS